MRQAIGEVCNGVQRVRMCCCRKQHRATPILENDSGKPCHDCIACLSNRTLQRRLWDAERDVNRAAIEHMTDLKRMIQSAIDAGEISNRSQLLALAAEQGLTVTRNGRAYAGFMTKSEKRYRVHFDFNDYSPKEPRAARLPSHITEPEQSHLRVAGPDEITPEPPHKGGNYGRGVSQKGAESAEESTQSNDWLLDLCIDCSEQRRQQKGLLRRPGRPNGQTLQRAL